MVVLEEVARFPHAALDDPGEALAGLDVGSHDEGLKKAVGVDEDVATPTAVQGVNDSAAVDVKGSLRLVGGEVVEYGRGHVTEQDVGGGSICVGGRFGGEVL